MSREALLLITGGLTDAALEQIGYEEKINIREGLDSQTAATVSEIEEATGLTLEFREASVGRGASGPGAVVQIVELMALGGGVAGGALAASQILRWVYHKIASSTGYRPMISLGAAEHLAMADLIDRVESESHLLGSGDMNSSSPDPSFTGGDAFFVVLSSESELHHYHITAYGEVHYIGTSPPIPHFMDAPSPPYWAGGDSSDT